MTTAREALELKPCPFCGGDAESDSRRGYRNISTGNPEKAAAIYCTKCSADMTWCYRDTPEIERDQVMALLIEQWNTRVILATGLVPDEAAIRAATSDMLLAGARSLGNTMGKPNFMQRAQACWDAMWKAKDGVVEPMPAAIRSNRREA